MDAWDLIPELQTTPLLDLKDWYPRGELHPFFLGENEVAFY